MRVFRWAASLACVAAVGCGSTPAAQDSAGSAGKPALATLPSSAQAAAAGSGTAGPVAAHGGAGGASSAVMVMPQPSAAGAHAAAAASAGSGGQPASAAPERVPCDVAKILAAQCQSCHGATPKLGAPMSLVSLADFHKPAPSDHSKQVYELVHTRVLSDQNPMPPLSAGQLAAPEQSALADWTAAAAPALAASAAGCPETAQPAMPSEPAQPTAADAADAHCYDLTVHGESSASDSSPFMVPPGESYNCFYFDAPWAMPTESVAFKSKLDNEAALHHWFLYAMPTSHAAGTVERNCSPLHLDGPQMLAGWAPGGKDMVMPDGVAAETAAPGTTLMLEWHYFNNTDAALADKSTVRVCGVPAGSRKNTASITWLGTEDFGLGMPPHEMTSVSGNCTPSRKGLAADAQIQLLYTIPHMHQYGTHMSIDLVHPDGTKQSVFDQPFSDKNQSFVETRAVVSGSDKLVTTCTYMNTSNAAVGYGSPFGAGEMCYAFVLAYPAHALDNGSRSLLGANNSCL